MKYEDLEQYDLQTMDGGTLDSAFRSLVTLSIENSIEAETIQKSLASFETIYEECGTEVGFQGDKKAARIGILKLKREEKINKIRSRAIDKLASRMQTLLRTFGR